MKMRRQPTQTGVTAYIVVGILGVAFGQSSTQDLAKANQALSVIPQEIPPVVLYELETATKKVELVNGGNTAVEFSASQQFSGLFGGWLSVSPNEGSVPPGGTVELTVGFDTADLYQGGYTGWLMIRSKDQEIKIKTTMYSFCGELRSTLLQAPEAIFLDEDAKILEKQPVWDTNPVTNETVWMEIPFRFTVPVYRVNNTVFDVSEGAEVLEVMRVDGQGGSVCGEFTARIKAAVDPWKRSSTTLCITLKGESVRSADETKSIPEKRSCQTISHQPHGRLFGVFMAHANDVGLVTSKHRVTILALFSEPLNELTFQGSSIIIQGPFGASVMSLEKVDDTGTHWHIEIDLGADYVGEVRVGIVNDGVQDLNGQPLAAVPVLTFRREKNIALQSVGYHINFVAAEVN